MIHQVEDGSALLYAYESRHDGGCNGDYWFETVEDAAECAFEDYGVKPEAWFDVPDPFEHCQSDWITPAKIPGRETGDPEWGRLQILQAGQWREIDMNVPCTVEIDYGLLRPSTRFLPNR